MVKLCECGCGQPAPIANMTNKKYGYVKGQPVRFIRGHNGKGKNNPSWNGGRHVDFTGYIRIKKPVHPRADSKGYVHEHVFIAEEILGKSLPKSACLHHANGSRADNRKENLVICQDQAYHKLLHRRQRAHEACGHANWRKCKICKQYDDPKNLYIHSSSVEHRSCKLDYNRARKQRI